MVGRKTEKSRVRRTIQRLQATMRIVAWRGAYLASNRSIGSPPGTGDGC